MAEASETIKHRQERLTSVIKDVHSQLRADFLKAGQVSFFKLLYLKNLL